MALRAHHEALLRSAVGYAVRGWPVFLLGRSKRPVANCPTCPKRGSKTGDGHDPEACDCLTCHGFYAATTDPQRIAAMIERVPRGLLAIRTGLASGLLVVDIDPRHGGRLDPVLMPPTHTIASGGGGWHLYYQHPGDPVLSRPMPHHPGIDIKADGGYVVAPPSIHPTTRLPYRTVGERAVNEMPPPLIAVVRAEPDHPHLTTQGRNPTRASPPTRSAPTPERGGTSNPTALLAAHLAAVTRAPGGKRRVTLYGASRGVARMVAAGVISPDDAIDVLTATGREVEQSDRDIQAAIIGGFRDEGVTL